MPRRLMIRFAVLAAAVALLLPASPATGASAGPVPEADSFERTPNLQPVGFGGKANPGSTAFISDLAFWGDKAYQGAYNGFGTFDISNPSNPVALDFTGCSGSQGDIVVWENILVRAWDGATTAPGSCDGQVVPTTFNGLHIFNLANPIDPVLVDNVPLPCGGTHTLTAVPDLENDRLLIYNGASNANCPWIEIIEIPLNNPTAAALIGVAPTGRSCHDNAVILGDANLVACAGGNGFTVLSIGGPRGGSLESPEQLYSKSIEGVSIGHAATFSWDGTILAFGHEPGGGTGPECTAEDANVKKTLFFYESHTGKELGQWILPRPQAETENCTLHNFNTIPSAAYNIMVMGNYQAGISVVDFTNPAQPREIAYADPAPLTPDANPASSAQDGGDWSTYWYDGYIYESDITRGLLVWQLLDRVTAGYQTLGHSNPQTQEFTIPFTGEVGTLRCAGKPITLFGSDGDDVLDGTAGRDVIATGNGNDVVVGKGGGDRICGGRGNDRLKGGGGNDRLRGQAGKDRIGGGPGNDVCKPGARSGRETNCERGITRR